MNACRYTVMIVAACFLTFCSSSKRISNPPDNSHDFVERTMLDNNTFKLAEISTDDSYGYTEKNPIKVGFRNKAGGPSQQRQFLNALLGPNGETVTYAREGSCCPFKTSHSVIEDTGLLDIYLVKYEGLSQPIKLYINMYDGGPLKAPKGFTCKR